MYTVNGLRVICVFCQCVVSEVLPLGTDTYERAASVCDSCRDTLPTNQGISHK